MRKREIGERVRVRNDLKNETLYGKEYFVGDMKDALGKVCKIVDMDDDGYYLDENESYSCYCFTDEMFVDSFQIGDTVKIAHNATYDNEEMETMRGEVGVVTDIDDVWCGGNKYPVYQVKVDNCEGYWWYSHELILIYPTLDSEADAKKYKSAYFELLEKLTELVNEENKIREEKYGR